MTDPNDLGWEFTINLYADVDDPEALQEDLDYLLVHFCCGGPVSRWLRHKMGRKCSLGVWSIGFEREKDD
jgi:hypothetical protein